MLSDPYPALCVGHRRQSRGRTITETDVVNFCMLTGNWLELHANKEFAAATRYGQRLVQGSLIFSVGNALLPFDPEVIDAFYGVDRLRFTRPSYIGDTIWSTSEITALQPRPDGGGVATLDLQVVNQRAEVVMRCDFRLLVRRERLIDQHRPGAAEPGEGR